MKITLWADVVDGYRESNTYQRGVLWKLEDVPWTAVPREGDSVQIGDLGDENDNEGLPERVSRVFWHDDGSITVECGQVFTCDMSLGDYLAALSRRGWVRHE